MSLKRMVDYCNGEENVLMEPLSFLYLNFPFFYGSIRVLDFSFMFTKIVIEPFIIQIYNRGFNNEKYILVARFTNNPNDIFYQEAYKFRKNNFQIYFDTIGKGEYVELFIYNMSLLNQLDLGILNFTSEVETL